MREVFGFAMTYSIFILIVGWFQLTILKKNTEWLLIYWFSSFFLLITIFSGLMLRYLKGLV